MQFRFTPRLYWKKLYKFGKKFYSDIPLKWHKMRLLYRYDNPGNGYRQYLESQLDKTIKKKKNDPTLHSLIIINQIEKLTSASENQKVLCIGCRNTIEIDLFKRKGFKNVVGIDLFSESPEIMIMDMHQMYFPDNYFSIIFSSHSLEHAYDIEKVVKEITRVLKTGGIIAVEVPVGFEPNNVDRIDFVSLKTLNEIFKPYVDDVLWTDEQPPFNEYNDQGKSIIRMIFTIKK